jgi:hypothetical protein
MYRSHPVRRMCEDPIEGKVTTLVVEPADDDRSDDALAAAIRVAGGTIEERMPYGGVRVSIPEPRVTDLCSLSGLDSVETAGVVGLAGDAGEDI